jgi:hypothetical protein
VNWFLCDFGYDAELLGRDEVDEDQFVGLKGQVRDGGMRTGCDLG